MAAPVKRFFFCICTTLAVLMSILNRFTHLITLLMYSGHKFIFCMVLLCMQYNVKLCCLFSDWFAKEANVANNKVVKLIIYRTTRGVLRKT